MIDLIFRLKFIIYIWRNRKAIKDLKRKHGRSWDKDMKLSDKVDIGIMTYEDYIEIDIDDIKLKISPSQCAILHYFLKKIY